MSTEILTLTEIDVEGFRRVCRYLWQGHARGPYLDVEDAADMDKVVTCNFSSVVGQHRREETTCDALIGASAELEHPE